MEEEGGGSARGDGGGGSARGDGGGAVERDRFRLDLIPIVSGGSV
jgi:hypothetical protein